MARRGQTTPQGIAYTKANQPVLLGDIRLTLDECIARPVPDCVVETPKPEHSYREHRSIRAFSALNDFLDFPGVGQVFAVRRDNVETESARRRCETACGSRAPVWPRVVSPQRLPALNRGHCMIEAMHHGLDWMELRRRPRPHRERVRRT